MNKAVFLVGILLWVVAGTGPQNEADRLSRKLSWAMREVDKSAGRVQKADERLARQFKELGAAVADPKRHQQVRGNLKKYADLKEEVQNLLRCYINDFFLASQFAGFALLERERVIYATWLHRHQQFSSSLQQRKVAGFTEEEDILLEKAFDIAFPGKPNPVRQKYRTPILKAGSLTAPPYFVFFQLLLEGLSKWHICILDSDCNPKTTSFLCGYVSEPVLHFGIPGK